MDHKTAAVEAHRAIESLRNEAAQADPSMDVIRRLVDDAHSKMWVLIDALDAAEIAESLPAPATH